MAAVLLSAVPGARAADGDPSPAAAATTLPALIASASALEGAPPLRRPLIERTQRRLGMHVVLRVGLVDFVSHPDSGSLDASLRSRLLGRPIARSTLALGLAWRF